MQLYIRNTKSRTDRYAILSKNTLNTLTDYWYKAGKPKGFLFPGYFDKDKPISKFTINHVFNYHSKKFGIKLTPHMLRPHTPLN